MTLVGVKSLKSYLLEFSLLMDVLMDLDLAKSGWNPDYPRIGIIPYIPFLCLVLDFVVRSLTPHLLTLTLGVS